MQAHEIEIIERNATQWTQNMIRMSQLQDENEILRLHNRILSEEVALYKVALKSSELTRHQAFDEMARMKVGK